MSHERATGQRVSPWARGPIVFAGGMLVIAGLMQVFIGTTALVHDKIYVGTGPVRARPHGVGLGSTANGDLVRGRVRGS